MISWKWLIDPIRVIIILFGIQFTSWWLLFPDMPTVPNGEPKEEAPILFVVLFSLFFFGILIGKVFVRLPKRRRRRSTIRFQDHGYFYRFARLTFWISTIAMFLQLHIFIQQPHLLRIFLEPAGQNRLARMMHESSPPGSPTISWFILAALAIFSLLSFSLPSSSKLRKPSARYVWISLGYLLILSLLGMQRQTFLLGIIVVAAAWTMATKRPLKLIPTALTVLILTLFIFVASAVRAGGVEGLVSVQVQERVLAEFVEKYTPGELNNAFIFMSYQTDVTRNWLYATMFDDFASDAFRPSRFLNTANSIGIWYWQFDWLSPLVVGLVGYFIGRLYGAAEEVDFRATWPSFFYLICLPAVFTMIRVNSFFLTYFVAPLFCLLAGWVFWHFREVIVFRARNKRTLVTTRSDEI